jgi:hypothetical protein
MKEAELLVDDGGDWAVCVEHDDIQIKAVWDGGWRWACCVVVANV